MIDPRFYDVPQPLAASEIASMLGVAVLRGDTSRTVTSLSSAARGGSDDLVFVEEPKDAASAKFAGVCLASAEAADAIPDGPTVIVTRHPRAGFAKAGTQTPAERRLPGGRFASRASTASRTRPAPSGSSVSFAARASMTVPASWGGHVPQVSGAPIVHETI